MSDAPQAMTLRAGRYAIIGVLGVGSQAETLDAVDKQAGRPVAIKRFHVRGAKSWKDVELAEREARVLSTLCHPNLPVYIEHFEEDGALYLVMEKIEGETLAALKRRKALLSQEDVTRFLRDADSALSYLHARVPPIIHRDIKPGNVIRRADGSFAFVDFGSVRDQLKPEGGSTVVGTFGYMAPEQFQGRALPGSDVYAVGATALSLVAGREPEDLPHRGLAIDVPGTLGRGAEPWLIRALSAMLEPDPDKRPSRVPAPGSGRRGAPDAEPTARRVRQDLESRIREETRRAQREAQSVRREAQRARDEARSVRREARSFRRARRPPWQRHRHGFGPVAPLLIVVVTLAFTAARLSNWALFRVLLPTLLSVLSLFFGRSLQRAAFRCRELGITADQGLRYALGVARGRLSGRELEVESDAADAPPESSNEPRVRVRVPSSGVRVEAAESADEPADFDDFSEASAKREARERR